MIRIFTLIVTLFAFQEAYSRSLDSLELLLKTEKNDRRKVDLLNELAETSFNEDFIQSEKYGKRALKLAEKIWYLEGKARALNALGKANIYLSEYEEGISHFKEAIETFYVLLDTASLAKAYKGLGTVYLNMADYPEAKKYYDIAIRHFRAAGDLPGEASCHINVGIIYQYLGNLDAAANCYFDALEIGESTNDLRTIGYAKNNIADIYNKQEKYELSIALYHESLIIAANLNDNVLIADGEYILGTIYLQLNQLDSAMWYTKRAFHIDSLQSNWRGLASKSILLGDIYHKMNMPATAELSYLAAMDYVKDIENNQQVMAHILVNFGTFCNETGQYERAIRLLTEAIIEAGEAGEPGYAYLAYQQTSISRAALNEFRQAYYDHTRYSSIKDSVINETNNKNINQLQAIYENNQKKHEIERLNDEALVTNFSLEAERADSARKDLQLLFLVIGLIAIVVMAVVFASMFRNRQKQNKILTAQKLEIEHQKQQVDTAFAQLEEKSNEILDSITYAKRIQAAILPSDGNFLALLPDSFILYEPKDIVAGDFYWIENPGDQIIFAVADCTGHGVPGAMVSVICKNALNRAVLEFKLTEPSLILNKAREIIVSEFEKSGSEVRDGMDISICSLNRKTHELKWAGANNPLWIVNDKGLTDWKPDKQPIGRYEGARPFGQKSTTLKRGDVLYLFSDGYADQFGGVNDTARISGGKKFKTSRLKELLLSIYPERMTDQKSKLKLAFDVWKGELEQIDDVCIIGVRL